jgi:dinuclear metal center YbgI/SA1388 family protein
VHLSFSIAISHLRFWNGTLLIRDLIHQIESWYPRGSAMPQDNPGLQVGDPSSPLKNVLVALDVTDEVIEEALDTDANLILSHHPMVFKPIQRIDASGWLGKKIARLLKHEVAVFSAHTNLDASRQGVSMVLAKLLGVAQPRFLAPATGNWLKKIAVFVPPENVDAVRAAMAQAGAGAIGDYCSFNLSGFGTFWGNEAAAPVLGQKERFETVPEIRLEMILPSWKLEPVVRAMKAVHPYEEVAFDLYPLENEDVNFGFGAIGDLEKPLPVADFVRWTRLALEVDAVGYCAGPKKIISRLAVCGGSGGDLIKAAADQGAEAFLTGEMKYHTLLEYRDQLTIILAGHYATEVVIVPLWAQRLRAWLTSEQAQVYESKALRNPMTYLT